MKSLIFAFATICIFATLTFGAKPPVKVQKAFEAKFANATAVKWAKENAIEWEAEFVADGVQMSANFTVTGEWVETETHIAIADLPQAVSDSIMKLYPHGKIFDTNRIESAKDGTKYETDVAVGKKMIEVIMKEDGTRVK